jgi:hypothetical protein
MALIATAMQNGQGNPNIEMMKNRSVQIHTADLGPFFLGDLLHMISFDWRGSQGVSALI